MRFFDDVNWLNLDWFFNLFYRIFVGLPKLILEAIYFWTSLIGSTDASWFKTLVGITTLLSGGAIFYTLYKLWLLLLAEQAAYVALFAAGAPEKEEKRIVREEWIEILEHIESPTQSRWVLAVIECDKILAQLLEERGYEGKDIGEMLKSERGQKLKTIQDAWEGHKIRNKIAHEPGYVLEKREAQVAASKYESVFKELGFLE